MSTDVKNGFPELVDKVSASVRLPVRLGRANLISAREARTTAALRHRARLVVRTFFPAFFALSLASVAHAQGTDTNPELLVDAIFAPVYYRLLLRFAPITEEYGSELITRALRGVRTNFENSSSDSLLPRQAGAG